MFEAFTTVAGDLDRHGRRPAGRSGHINRPWTSSRKLQAPVSRREATPSDEPGFTQWLRESRIDFLTIMGTLEAIDATTHADGQWPQGKFRAKSVERSPAESAEQLREAMRQVTSSTSLATRVSGRRRFLATTIGAVRLLRFPPYRLRRAQGKRFPDEGTARPADAGPGAVCCR